MITSTLITSFDLPMPPSVNRRIARLGNASPEVERWHTLADRQMIAVNRTLGLGTKRPLLEQPFALHITWDRQFVGRRDIDNAVKPLLDYLQRIEICTNDKLCRELHVAFGEAPIGCQVDIWSIQEPEEGTE